MRSKIILSIFLLATISLGIWGYGIFNDRYGNVTDSPQSNTTDSTAPPSSPSINEPTQNDGTSTTIEDPTNNEEVSPTIDDNVPPVSISKDITENILAHITPQHCDTACQAFASDLKLFEYCEQTCGISPIKNVSNCDDKKGIQKDYCLKDLAITTKDVAKCNDINDANIKQSCLNFIKQNSIEDLPRSNPDLNQ